MTFLLPSQNKRWIQTNNSDRFGTLAFTKNIQFDKEGYLTLSKRVRNIFDADTDAQIGEIVAFAYDLTTDRYYVLTEDQIFYIDNVLQTITQDVSANVPTTLNDRSDIVAFNGNIYVSAGTADDLRRWTGSAWSTALYSLTSNSAPMAVFENKVALAIGQDNTVILLNTSHTLVQTLTLPDDYRVTSMAWSNNRLYVATRHTRDGEALLFEWDGNTSSANNGYPCGSVRIDSVKAWRNTVVCFTGLGQLLAFDGSGLVSLANLPVYYTDRLYTAQGNTLEGATSHRGMVVDGDVVYVNLKSTLRVSADDDLQPNFVNTFVGGVWCYDPTVGFYHRHAPTSDIRSITNAVTTANVNTTTEVITVAGATVPVTGTPVLYDDGANGSGTAIGGLKHRKKYYVIYQSATTMKLATTKALADAGTAIDLTGTGNNAQFFIFIPNRDFGQDRHNESTAIGLINISDPIPSDGKHLLIGNTIPKTDVTTTKHVIGTVVDLQENRGYFGTARLEPKLISDIFQDVTIKFRNIRTAEDKILVKYRVVEREDDHKHLDTKRTQTGTWSDSDTFTTTADLSDVNVGDEVSIHFGSGAGYTAHISSLSEAGGTYTVNLDEQLQNITAADTMLFTIDNWQRLTDTSGNNSVTTSDVLLFTNANGNSVTSKNGSKTFAIGQVGQFLQLKIELRGEDVSIEDILVNNQPFTTFVA